MAARRKVNDREEATALLDEFSASGFSLSEFCGRHGLDARSLNCWRLNLGRKSSDEPRGVRLLELAVPPRSRSTVYRVDVEGIVVEVPDDFDEGTLARLLRVVAAC